ncbi:histidine kinase [Streptomyces sp. LP11]|uniref:histidine kinase n=1 Tax=Streptomyces pyxinicus TaxID=2970331 RepID=A0ABT2B147_9ACTN|nr:histidine kinase [Streptomyces sp. LP11]MCS0602243.1 histidine kinase [Streptomyces sp. LP11]
MIPTDRATPGPPTGRPALRRTLSASGLLTGVGAALRAPGVWTGRRVLGEALLASGLGLSAFLLELSADGGTARSAAVGLAAGTLSVLRRFLPATVLLAVVSGCLFLEGLTVLLPVASWSAGRRVGRPGRAAGVFAAACAVNLAGSLYEQLPRFSSSYAVFCVLVLLAVVAAPGLAGRHWSQRRTLTDTLREYHGQLLRERGMIADQARLRERQRIAQDMHDSLGHQLVLISVQAGALEVDSRATERHRRTAGVLREASVAAMRELREVVGLLRDEAGAPGRHDSPEPPAPDVPGTPPHPDEPGAGTAARGVAGIDRLVKASRDAGATVVLRRYGDSRPLPPAADHTAYRLVQEGLTNAHKHAPGAAITVDLRYEPDALVVAVVNGPGHQGPDSDGARRAVGGRQGLTGLTERARLVGGIVNATATADGGHRVAAVLPYAPVRNGGTALPEDATATFVPPSDDFREQPTTVAHGESEGVSDWDEMSREVTRIMRKNSRRSGVVLGCGTAVLAILLAGIAAVVYVYFSGEADKAMISPRAYDAVRVGASEAEVRERLPDGDSFLTVGLDKGAPPEPAGAKCLSLNSTESGSRWNKSPVFRFCFKDGRLIEKKAFEVKM